MGRGGAPGAGPVGPCNCSWTQLVKMLEKDGLLPVSTDLYNKN